MEKTCCRQQKKRIDLFFKRQNASVRFSDIPLCSLITQNICLGLCFKTVIDPKKLLTRKSNQLEKVIVNIWSCVCKVCTYCNS